MAHGGDPPGGGAEHRPGNRRFPLAAARLGRIRVRAHPVPPCWPSARRGPCAGWCGRRANSVSPGPTSPGTSTSRATSTRRSTRLGPVGRLSTRGDFARPTARQWIELARSARAPRRRRAAARTAAGGVPPSAAGRRHSPRPRRRRRHAPLRRRQRLLRPGAGPDPRLLLRRLDRRGHRPGRRPARQARPGLPQARPAARACGCSTSAAAGAAWRCTPPRQYGADVVGITLSDEQATSPGSGSPRPGSTAGSTSGSRTTARSTTGRSTP